MSRTNGHGTVQHFTTKLAFERLFNAFSTRHTFVFLKDEPQLALTAVGEYFVEHFFISSPFSLACNQYKNIIIKDVKSFKI
jgi:hypothetical protein